MELRDKVAVVTGAASGIGRAMAIRFSKEGAKAVVCADLNLEGAEATAKECNNGSAYKVDVSKSSDIENLVNSVEKDLGRIDLFCSNAGIGGPGNEEASDDAWQQIWDINVMSHVYAARYVIPGMLARGGGYLLNTSSAAGLLTQIGSASYATTKHAAVGFAEYLAIRYGDKGIGVSVLCPQAVRTPMTAGAENGGVAGVDGMIEPEQAVDEVINTLRDERFLVLPHQEVLTYMRRKTDDYDRWIKGMRRLRNVYIED